MMHVMTWLNLENIMLCERKPVTKNHTPSHPIYMKCLEQASPYRQKVGEEVPEAERRGGRAVGGRHRMGSD